jgi:hypothetical protein
MMRPYVQAEAFALLLQPFRERQAMKLVMPGYQKAVHKQKRSYRTNNQIHASSPTFVTLSKTPLSFY